MSSFWSSVIDLFRISRVLIPLKIFILLFELGINCFMPFLSIHMSQVGLSAEDIGYVDSMAQFAAMAGPPLIGLVADKLGRYKILFISVLSTVVITYSSTLFLPYIEVIRQQTSAFVSPVNHSLIAFSVSQCDENKLCSEAVINTSISVNDTCEISSITMAPSVLLHQLQKNTSDGCVWNASMPWNYTDVTSECVQTTNTTCTETRGSHSVLFLSYSVIRTIGAIFSGICYVLFDGIVLAVSRQHEGEYGKQQMWGTVPQLIAPPIAGIIIDSVNIVYGGSDVWPAIVIYFFLELIAIIILSIMDLKVQFRPENILKNIKQMFTNAEILLLYTFCVMMGTIHGFVSTFLSLYLYNLGASKFLIGLARTVGGIAGFPVLFFADPLVYKFGASNVLALIFGIHMFRLITYSLITNPYWALFLDAFRSFTNNLHWVAIVIYGSAIIPKGLLVTFIGTMETVYYGCGIGVGSLIGGLLIGHFGERIAFRSMGFASGVVCVIYLIAFHLIVRRRRKPVSVVNEVAKTEEEPKPLQQITPTQ